MIKLKNNAKTTLKSVLSDSALTMEVNDSSVFPTLPLGSDYFYVSLINNTDIEIVKVTNITGLFLTIVRAQDSTSALSFPINAKVELRLNTQTLLDTISDNAIPMTFLDTDILLAADSDLKVPSQKAIKTYVDSELSSIINPLLYKSIISINTDFPTLANVKTGWYYHINSNVIDNNATRTNTGLTFTAGDEIVWNGSSWDTLGSIRTVGHTIQDEGSSLIQRSKINFVGSGVIATDDSGNDATLVTIAANVVGPASAVDSNLTSFDTTTGKLIKDSGVKTSDLILKGDPIRIAVFNASGAPITKGSAVKATTATLGIPNITKANAMNTGNEQVIGLVESDIADNASGYVVQSGLLSGINLAGYNVGDILYLSDTVAGAYVAGTSSLAFSSRGNQIGYITDNTASGKIFVQIVNENINTSLTVRQNNIVSGNTMSTGVYEFSGLVSTSPTFTIPVIKGWIVENTGSYSEAPIITRVYYPGSTGNVITNLASQDATWILISKTNTIIQQGTEPTPDQRRDNIFLGKILHYTRNSIVNINSTADYDTSPMSALKDMFTSMPLINSGISPYPDGSNLNFNTSGGKLIGMGINWSVSNKNPNTITIAVATPRQFRYSTQTQVNSTFLTNITPGFYDSSGTITAIPSPGDHGGNRSTNIRFYLTATNVVVVQYGQQVYESLALALAAQQTETFIKNPQFGSSVVLIGLLAVRRTTTTLNDSNYAVFTPASMFGESVGGVNGISTTTLQQAYNNSITPEITTDAILGALTVKRGSGADTDNVIEVLNGAGSIVARVDGNGNIIGNGNTITKDPTGFVNGDNISVTGNPINRTITLVGTVEAYWRGALVPSLISGYVSPAHGTDTAQRYYLSFDGDTIAWSTTVWTFDNLQIAVAFYDSVNASWIYVRETHGLMTGTVHQELHETIGTYKQSGGAISGYTLNSTTAANRRPDVAACYIKDEDLVTINSALTSKLYTQFYLSGAGAVNNFILSVADIVPLLANNPYYNQFTSGAWQQTLMPNNSYMSIWLLEMPMASDAGSQALRHVWVQGQSVSTTLANEQAVQANSINIGNINLQENIFVGRVIVRYTGGNWQLIQVDTLSGTRISQGSSTSSNFLSSVSTGTGLSGNGTVTSPLNVSGPVTDSGLTVSTGKILGRFTATTGAVEEIGVSGSGSVALTDSPIFTTQITAPTLFGSTITSGVLKLRGNSTDLTTGGVNFLDTLDASSTTVASVVMSGGLGVAKKAFFGSTITALGNMFAPNNIDGQSSTVTATGNTILTVSSNKQQFFTGTAAQTVTLPDVTTLTLGHQFFIYNASTLAITVNSSGGNAVVVMNSGTWATVICIALTGATAASWNLSYFNLTATSGTKYTMPTTTATIARTDSAQTFTGVQTMTSPSITTGMVTASTSFALFNTVATTLNIGGAATTLTVGGTPTTAVTHSYSANATATGTTKTVNLATAGAAGSTTDVNIGSAVASAVLGTLTLGFPTIVQPSNLTSLSLFNTQTTTLNLGGALTTFALGNTATAAQTVNLFTSSTGASTYNFATGAVANATTKTLNIGTGGASGSTTNINIGNSVAGTTTINSPTLALGAGSLTMTGSLGATAARLIKGWFTDLEVTNTITGSISGNATTVTTNADLSGVITSVGNTTSWVTPNGTGNVVLTDSPLFTTKITTPALYGSTLTAGVLNLQGNSADTTGQVNVLSDLVVGSNTAGKTAKVQATYGAEMAPAIVAGNWTLGTGWSITGGVLSKANSVANQTATPSGAFAVVAGRTYKVSITTTAYSGTIAYITYTIGGVYGSIITNIGTVTDYIVAQATGKLIFTDVSTAETISISAISVKELTLGTGTLTAEGSLVVQGLTNFVNPVCFGINAPTIPIAPITVIDSGSGEGIRIVRSGLPTQYLSISEGGASMHRIAGYGDKVLSLINYSTTYGFNVYVNNATNIALSILPSGNTGIGTTVPQVLHEVAGEHRSTGLGASAFESLFRVNGTYLSPTAVALNDIVGTINLGGQYSTTVGQLTAGASVSAVAAGAYTSITAKPTDLLLSTANATGAVTEKLRVTGAGFVGIGTSAPNVALEVVGNIRSVGVAAVSTYTSLRINGTYAAPTAVLSGEQVGTFQFGGQYDTTVGHVTAAAQIYGVAQANYTSSTAKPTDLVFAVAPASGAMAEAVRIAYTGFVGMGTSAPTSKLTLSLNAAAPVAPIADTVLQIVGADAAASRMQLDSYGGNCAYTYRRANGTAAAPTRVLSGDFIGNLVGLGYYTGGYATTAKASINFQASEDWVDATHTGTDIVFNAVAPATGTIGEIVRFKGDGTVNIGTSTSFTTAQLSVMGGAFSLVGATVSTDATIKNCRIGGAHYTNSEEPATIAFMSSTATENSLAIGGGTPLGNAATSIEFRTAANTTTVTGTIRLAITADGRIYGTALHNNAGDLSGTTNQYIASGTYTPTLTSVNGINGATTTRACQWMRVGNVVTVTGQVDAGFNNGGAQLGVSLPIASNFTTQYQCAGTAVCGAQQNAVQVIGDATNDRAVLTANNIYNNNTSTWSFTFTYVIL